MTDTELDDDALVRLARAVVYAQEQGADDDLPEALTELRAALGSTDEVRLAAIALLRLYDKAEAGPESLIHEAMQRLRAALTDKP